MIEATWYNLKRAFKFWWQRRTRGWDDSETWNLDATVARFMLPRLQRFRELPHGIWRTTEVTEDEFNTSREFDKAKVETEAALDEIEWFLTIHASDEGTWVLVGDPDAEERYNKAARIFGENFGHLWS